MDINDIREGLANAGCALAAICLAIVIGTITILMIVIAGGIIWEILKAIF